MKMNYHTDAMQEECKVVGALPSAGLTAAGCSACKTAAAAVMPSSVGSDNSQI